MQQQMEENHKLVYQTKVQNSVLQTLITNLKSEQNRQTEQITALNKSREEIRSSLNEKEVELAASYDRIKDRDEQIRKVNYKMNEIEHKNHEMQKKLHALEQEKKSGRLDFDNQRKTLSDRIAILDAQLCNEIDSRKHWQAQYENECKLNSEANIEITELKNKQSQAIAKIQHFEVETESLRIVNYGLTQSKAQLQTSLNTYIAKCESLENEIYSITQIAKDFERQREIDNINLSMKIEALELEKANLEMSYEELYTRSAFSYSEIQRYQSSYLSFALGIHFLQLIFAPVKSNYDSMVKEISRLSYTLKITEGDLESLRSSLAYMKDQISAKDRELEQFETKFVTYRRQTAKMDEINGRLMNEVKAMREQRLKLP